MRLSVFLKPIVILCGLLGVGGWLAVPCCWPSGQQAPASRAVLLKNGRVLFGRPAYVGEQCIIALENGVEVRLPARDIAADCRDLLECYEQLRRSLPQGKQAAPHLDLAQWCLRYGLLEQASEQVLTAMRVEPNHAGIDALLRQIRAAGDKGADAAGQTPPRAADTLRAAPLDELDQLARSVPQPALAMFASRVQPLLINRCGGSACHTGHRAGAFRLLEPPRGGTYFRRLTLRNLQTTLAQVNLEVPDESPLLATPQKAHGPTNVVVISGQSDQLYRQLREWIDKLNGLESKADSLDAQSEENKSPGGEVSQEGSPPESNSIGRMVPTQPADATAKSAVPFGSAEPPKGTRFSAVPPSRSGAAERDEKRVVSPLIGDPFDPSLFNRKFHGRP